MLTLLVEPYAFFFCRWKIIKYWQFYMVYPNNITVHVDFRNLRIETNPETFKVSTLKSKLNRWREGERKLASCLWAWDLLVASLLEGVGQNVGGVFNRVWLPSGAQTPGYWLKSSWFLALSHHHTSKVINTMSLCSSFFRRVRSTCKFYEMKKKSPLWSQLSRRRRMTGYDLAGQWKGSDQNQFIA